jgi:two-component system sensor histidine kinase/response regulator
MDEKKRILIVDDEVAVTETLQAYLEGTGRYEVKTANHSGEALSQARSLRPHLVLLDVTMPDMDGGEIAARMENDEQLRGVPIIFLTGIVSDEEVEAIGRKIGNRPVIAKPASAKTILSYIERYTE